MRPQVFHFKYDNARECKQLSEIDSKGIEFCPKLGLNVEAAGDEPVNNIRD